MAFGNYEFPHSHNYDSDLRELINMVDEFRQEYLDILEETKTIRAEFADLQTEFNKLDKRVSDLFGYVDNRLTEMFSEYKSIIDQEITDMQEQIVLALKEIADILPAAQAYADAKDELVKAELYRAISSNMAQFQIQLDELKRRLDNLKVEAQSPFTGYKAPSGEILEGMNRKFRVHALTNNEYSDLGMRNDEYEEVWMLTNWQYLIEGKTLLQRRWLSKLNPVTGQLTTDYNIHSYLAGLILGTLTADDYAEQNLTNDEYDSLSLTNEDYFFTTAENLPWVLPTESTGDSAGRTVSTPVEI